MWLILLTVLLDLENGGQRIQKVGKKARNQSANRENAIKVKKNII